MAEAITPPTWAVVGEQVACVVRPMRRNEWCRPATVVSVGKLYITVKVDGAAENERFRMDRDEMIDGAQWLSKREPGIASFFLGPLDSDRYRAVDHDQRVRAYAQRAEKATDMFASEHTVENAKRAIALLHSFVRVAEAS